MNHDGSHLFTVLLAVGFGLFFFLLFSQDVQHSDECSEDQRGALRGRVTLSRAADTEVCNGRRWIPYRVQLPAEDMK